MATIEKRQKSWALYDPNGVLVCLCLYKIGAMSVAIRLGWKVEFK